MISLAKSGYYNRQLMNTNATWLQGTTSSRTTNLSSINTLATSTSCRELLMKSLGSRRRTNKLWSSTKIWRVIFRNRGSTILTKSGTIRSNCTPKKINTVTKLKIWKKSWNSNSTWAKIRKIYDPNLSLIARSRKNQMCLILGWTPWAKRKWTARWIWW